MTLRFNPKLNEFYLPTVNKAKAEETGLTLSTNTTGPMGEPIYYTNSPYAALNFYTEGDSAVKDKLGPLWHDYEMSWAADSPNHYPMGTDVVLRPYQNAAIDYALLHTHVLIGDAPGIGKTLTAIGLCNVEKAKRILVVCPAGGGLLRDQWKREIKRGSTIDKVRVSAVARSADGIASWANYIVISYDLLRNPGIHEAICACEWDAMILDEAHMLKEPGARRTQAVFGGGRRVEFKDPIASHVKRIIAMTGTPLPNRPRECFTITQALCHEAIDYMREEDFTNRFNPSGLVMARRKTLPDGSLEPFDPNKVYRREEQGRLPELHARLRCNFMVRRLKEDVLKDLPPKTYELSYIESNGTIADIIRREKMLNYTIDDLKKPDIQLLGQISTLRREMGEAKVPQTLEHVKYLLDVVEIPKVVLFCNHRSVMDALRNGLQKYGVSEVRGGMTNNQRLKALNDFVNGDNRVFIGQLEAAGVGLDGLQKVCSHVVIVEPAWTSGSNEQAVDRLHRSEQLVGVIVQFIVVEGSLDEYILATVIGKTYIVYETLDNRKRRPG